MKIKYFLYSSIFLLFLASCRKNQDLTEVIVTYPEAEEIVLIQLAGNLTDELGNPLGNTTVELYKKAELVQSVQTNQDGDFLIEGLNYTDATFLLWAKTGDSLSRL